MYAATAFGFTVRETDCPAAVVLNTSSPTYALPLWIIPSGLRTRAQVVVAFTASLFVPSLTDVAVSTEETEVLPAVPALGVTSSRISRYLAAPSAGVVQPVPVTAPVMSVPVL